MFITRKFAIMFLLLLSVGSVVWSQVLPATSPVYVSGGPTIYTLTNGNTLTPIFTNANMNFESLAIGPDNATDVADLDAGGNAKYAYFLYACDPAGTILRFAFLAGAAPAPPAGPETVYDATVSPPVAGFAPVCGRSSSAGDFYVTNKSGSGVFVFSGIANIGFGSLTPSTPGGPSLKSPKMTGRGITQKYVGDLLFVDNSNNQVLRSPYAVPFATQSTFINSNLNGPVGIAAAVTTTLNVPSGVFVPTSNFFVANSNSSKILPAQPPVSVFKFDDGTQMGVPDASRCPGLNLPQGGGPPQVADYLASVPTANADNSAINNTLYLVTNSNNSGSLWTWNTAQAQAVPPNCTLTKAASIGTALSGVAVAPAPVTLNLSVSATAANPTPTTFNFNSSIFQLTASGANNLPCAASVTAYPLSLATVISMIKDAQLPGSDTNYHTLFPLAPIVPPLPNPSTPLANLGDGGFETAYVAHWPSCVSVFGDGGFVTGIFNFVDSNQFLNPRAVQCDNSDSSTEPQLFAPNNVGTTTTCGSPQPLGVYPLGGPIAGDLGTKSNSVFAMVNENLGTAEPGQFCGFQNPLTGDGTHLPSPPPSFNAGGTNTVNVKFKLSTPAGNCKKDFITDAVALISVARISDANGAPAFNAINVQATASSLDLPPLFNSGNQQYSFTLNLPSVFAQGGAGTYSLTVTFLSSSNAVDQTTLFTLKQ